MPRTSRFFPTLFCGEACDARELAELKRLATPIRFEGGQTIFSEGDAAKNAFGLSYGMVRIYRLLPCRRQVVAFAFPGDFLVMPLADRFSFSADAIGKVDVCKFPREEVKRLIETSPNIMRLLIEFAARELQSAQDQLTLLGTGGDGQSNVRQAGTEERHSHCPARCVADRTGANPTCRREERVGLSREPAATCT